MLYYRFTLKRRITKFINIVNITYAFFSLSLILIILVGKAVGRPQAEVHSLEKFAGVYTNEYCVFSFWIESQKLKAHFFSASHQAKNFFAYEVFFHSLLPNGSGVVSLLPFDFYKQVSGGKPKQGIRIFFKSENNISYSSFIVIIEISSRERIVCKPINWDTLKFFSGEYQIYQDYKGLESLTVKMEGGRPKPLLQYGSYKQKQIRNIRVNSAFIPFCSSPDMIQVALQIRFPDCEKIELLTLSAGCCPGVILAELHNAPNKYYFKTHKFNDISIFQNSYGSESFIYQYFEKGKPKEFITLAIGRAIPSFEYKNEKLNKSFSLAIQTFSFDTASFFTFFPGQKRPSYCLLQEYALIIFAPDGSIKRYWLQ
jgi:hypothetical protein